VDDLERQYSLDHKINKTEQIGVAVFGKRFIESQTGHWLS
jgi:hypothetical protein